MNTDLLGDTIEVQHAPFVRNTRPSVAEEKAVLALELARLCRTPPRAVTNGGIKVTRDWREAAERALKKLQSKRASVAELSIAIASMRGFDA